MQLVGNLFLLLLSSSCLLRATSSRVPANHAGAPGGGACSQCHRGASARGPSSRLELSFTLARAYHPGAMQEVTVTIHSRTPRSRFGFQITARDAKGRQAGKFSSTEPEDTDVQLAGGFEYVNHKFATAKNEFRFLWTPPSYDAGEIRFWASAVASGSGGEEVLSAEHPLQVANNQLPPSGYLWTELKDFASVTGFSNDHRIVGLGSNLRPRLRNPDGSSLTIEFPGSTNTALMDVNSSGAVIGNYTDANGRMGFLRSADGQFTTIRYPGASATELIALTDNGLILGKAVLSGVDHYFRRSASGDLQLYDRQVFDGPLTDMAADGTVLGFRRTAVFPVFQLISWQPPASPTMVRECSTPGSVEPYVKTNDNLEIAYQCQTFFGESAVILPSGQRIFVQPPTATSYRILRVHGISSPGHLLVTAAPVGDPQPMLLSPCESTLSGPPIRFSGTGGSALVRIHAPPNCRPVVNVTGSFGASDAAFGHTVIRVTASPSPTGRSGSISVGSVSIPITQEALTACAVDVVPLSHLPASGGNLQVSVSALPACPWSVSGVPDWIQSTASSGTGSVSLQMMAQPNSGARRSAELRIGNAAIVLTQLAPTECTIILEHMQSGPYFADMPGAWIRVATNPGCAWALTSAAPWAPFARGQGTAQSVTGTGTSTVFLSFGPNLSGYPRTAAISGGIGPFAITQSALRQQSGRFVPTTPCRTVDTRPGSGKSFSFGEPAVLGQRTFRLYSAGCGLGSSVAVSANITAVPHGPLSYLSVLPSSMASATSSILNSWDGRIVANALIHAAFEGDLHLFSSDLSDVIVDLNGYFARDEGLAFYPVPPCRISDTRQGSGKSGEFGPPFLAGGSTRTMRPPLSGCGVPPTAQAYSLNVTAVPPAPLAYITAWPAGQEQAVVSTLNAFQGQVVANAAIVPSGADGGVSFFASNRTDLVVDINGYFAPQTPQGLKFYPLAPCRVADTRPDGGKSGPFGPPVMAAQSTRTIPVPQAGCGAAAEAKAYSLNITVIPRGSLGYLTIWPDGQPQPLVSTLNSWNGQVLANAAIVPAGTNGAIKIYVSDATDVIVDVNGVFAP
ncbi:MAG: hypothetical protein JNL98_16465 [Bryobacterales bacterium]|nr:hypothetical protein [Bryobacterales bacterium]